MRAKLLLAGLGCLCVIGSYAWNPPKPVNSDESNSTRGLAANCAAATAVVQMEFNNVQAFLTTGGSVWYNRAGGIAGYMVPKEDGNRVIFAGALWIGGKDPNGQLKLAAMQFAQGQDFWPGPLSGKFNAVNDDEDATRVGYGSAEITAEECKRWDRFYQMNRQEVKRFSEYWDCKNDNTCSLAEEFAGYVIPSEIINWPAHGDVDQFQDYFLAPFYDRDGDLEYDPEGDGDYPYYDINNNYDCGVNKRVILFGDNTYWWIFNDKGNAHTESKGQPIGMEIRAQAFAFNTGDEVNDMTFYNYEMVNKGTLTLTETYFAVWVDPDIGTSQDDFIGCDVARGLGYAYNGDPIDDAGAGNAIGPNPPAIGVDFFQGPYQDSDGIDNPGPVGDTSVTYQEAVAGKGIVYKGIGVGYGDGVADNERFGMRRFMHITRSGVGGYIAGVNDDPSKAVDYYNYMTGKWKDGSALYHGGSGVDKTINGIKQTTDYAFPGDTDPIAFGTEGVQMGSWTELSAGNTAGDRRFVQAAGPFRLEPGAVNNITVGVVYARAISSTNSFLSVEKVRIADDKAQALFDNCFEVLNGPIAPDLTIQELDGELIFMLSGTDESYEEEDPFIFSSDTTVKNIDKKFRFQGYQVFQLKDRSVSSSDLGDPNKAALVFQCDIEDSVGQLINFELNPALNVLEPELMVAGTDTGISHSFRLFNDEFAEGDKALINHKEYYFMAVSYAHNNFKTFDPLKPDKLDGQKKPYLRSRFNVRTYTAIPHIVSPEQYGTEAVASYGDAIPVTRLEGKGNGGYGLKLSQEVLDKIASDGFQKELTYEAGYGPVYIKVVDPLSVAGGDFELRFLPRNGDNSNEALDSASWYCVNLTEGDTVRSTQTIARFTEHIIPKWGISIGIGQYNHKETLLPPNILAGKAGYDASKAAKTSDTEGVDFYMDYAVSNGKESKWFRGVSDIDGNFIRNWIRSGRTVQDCVEGETPSAQSSCVWEDFGGVDPEEDFEKVADGLFAPYQMTAYGDDQNYSKGRGALHSPRGKSITVSGLWNKSFDKLGSISIVFTSDKSKWTRCVVVETHDDPSNSVGGTRKLSIKPSPSVDRDGNTGTNEATANGSQPTGCSWFPGYVVSLETGERLNVAFGEDSWLKGSNGDDMLFNPTSDMYLPGGDVAWGGKHWLYIFGNHRADQAPTANLGKYQPRYDNAVFNHSKLMDGGNSAVKKVWESCLWVGCPTVEPGFKFLESDLTITIQTKQRYSRYAPDGRQDLGDLNGSENSWNPLYRFNLDKFKTKTKDRVVMDSAMKLINVVPNPYYAYSSYEENRYDNEIKIVNLPKLCDIDIYMLDGTLVKSISKDNDLTFVNWDLKNFAQVPIVSGVYLMHVKVPDVGERILKWFGVMRQADLEDY